MSLLLAAELPEVGAATGSAGLAWLLVALPAAGALVLFLAGRRADAWGHLVGVFTVIAAFVVGVITKRNVIAMFMCIELMLNAVNLTFAFSSYFGDVTGQLFVFIVMTVAAAEAAVGLGIIIAIFRNRESLNVDEASVLKL